MREEEKIVGRTGGNIGEGSVRPRRDLGENGGTARGGVGESPEGMRGQPGEICGVKGGQTPGGS